VIIDKIQSSDTDGCSNVECEITLEAGGEESQYIFARTELPQTLEADPNGFLLGAFVPAWAAGESRIRIEGAICPLLAANLTIVASTFQSWFTDWVAPPIIECDYEYRPPGARGAAFLSGGVDSLAMIRNLTARRPPSHPDRPSAAIVVDYQHVGGIDRTETDARFTNSLSTSREICADIGLDVIPIRSNFCTLNPSMRLWMYRYHGAFLASMAHFLGREFRLCYIASSYPATHLVPWGSHPQLDPFYSSQHVRIAHDGIELSRLQKVEALRDWPAALDRLYVCTSNTSGGANCGKCEKCVRTRVHLLVAGVLADAGAFDGADVTAEEIRAVRIQSEYARICFEEAVTRLNQLGRRDLTEAIEGVLAHYARSQAEKARHAQRSPLRRVARNVTRFFPR
jgi:hypothetical protein